MGIECYDLEGEVRFEREVEGDFKVPSVTLHHDFLIAQAEALLKKNAIYQKIEAILSQDGWIGRRGGYDDKKENDTNNKNSEGERKNSDDDNKGAVESCEDWCKERDAAVQSLRFLSMFYNLSPQVFFTATCLFDTLVLRLRILPKFYNVIQLSCFYLSVHYSGQAHLVSFDDIIKFTQSDPSLLHSTTSLILFNFPSNQLPTPLVLLQLFFQLLLFHHPSHIPSTLRVGIENFEALLSDHTFTKYRMDTLLLCLTQHTLSTQTDLSPCPYIIDTIKQLTLYCQISTESFKICFDEIEGFLSSHNTDTNDQNTAINHRTLNKQLSYNPRLKLMWTVSKKLLCKLRPSTRAPNLLEPLFEEEEEDGDEEEDDEKEENNEEEEQEDERDCDDADRDVVEDLEFWSFSRISVESDDEDNDEMRNVRCSESKEVLSSIKLKEDDYDTRDFDGYLMDGEDVWGEMDGVEMKDSERNGEEAISLTVIGTSFDMDDNIGGLEGEHVDDDGVDAKTCSQSLNNYPVHTQSIALFANNSFINDNIQNGETNSVDDNSNNTEIPIKNEYDDMDHIKSVKLPVENFAYKMDELDRSDENEEGKKDNNCHLVKDNSDDVVKCEIIKLDIKDKLHKSYVDIAYNMENDVGDGGSVVAIVDGKIDVGKCIGGGGVDELGDLSVRTDNESINGYIITADDRIDHNDQNRNMKKLIPKVNVNDLRLELEKESKGCDSGGDDEVVEYYGWKEGLVILLTSLGVVDGDGVMSEEGEIGVVKDVLVKDLKEGGQIRKAEVLRGSELRGDKETKINDGTTKKRRKRKKNKHFKR